MAKKEKKVLLFLMEGESDKISLEGVLKDFFSNQEVFVHILRCDITVKDFPCGSDILSKFKEPIDDFLSITKFHKEDILKIIHIVDMDGAYIPDSQIVKSEKEDKIKYNEEYIFTSNPNNIIKRNEAKSSSLNKLCTTKYVYKDIPYNVYFFSRNLEHVLHNRIDNLSNSDKAQLSDEFDMRFEGKLDDFIGFICDITFAVNGDYKESWEFIKKDCNSLKRYSNVHLIFNKDKNEE